MQRVVVACWIVAGFVLFASDAAAAMTLKLTFSDGQPMTYGSACSGDGCLQRGAGVQTTDAHGEILLADAPDRIVEYRRDGIALALLTPGSASGRLAVVGERATVVLPRLLQPTAPAVDAVEWDIASRINQQRSVLGLALAEPNARLSAAADLQATWLNSTFGLALPVISHIGPFDSTLPFRLGSVSFPEPAAGSEIAAAGYTPEQALLTWMGSAPHRDQVLAPGAQLIGVAMVGSVIIVTTHPPCDGCGPAASANTGAGAPLAPGGTSATTETAASRGGTSAGPHGSAALPGRAGDRAPSCGAEQLRVQRLRNRHRRTRVRVRVRCLRHGADYKLSVMQRPSRSILTRRRLSGPVTMTLALRPARTTRTLRIKLRRNGRVVAVRSVVRGPAERR